MLFSGNRKDKSHVNHHLGLPDSLVINITTSSCVIEYFLEKPWLDGDDVLAYFYCSRTSSDTRLQDPSAILLSVLRQLAAPLPGLPLKSPIISTFEKETTRGSQEANLSINEIITLLTELIQNHYKNVTLIFDALDECDSSGRSQLLDAFTKLTYNPRTTVKTLISSRDDSDVEKHFSKIPNLSITSTDNAGDIMKFVHKEISRRLLRGRASKQIRERVEDDLNKKANGVFRWVALQVDTLCDPERVYSVEDVEYLLPKLPKTLEDTYSRILDDLETLPPFSRETIQNLLKLLICAEYPMSIAQVLEALTILSASRQTAWDQAMIIKMARGLVAVEFERDGFVFAHLSVKESLEKRKEFSGECAHVVAAEACLKVYLTSISEALQCREFRHYALTHLGRHCLKSGALRKEPRLRDLMDQFLIPRDSNDAFERWNRECFLTDEETARGTCNERRHCQSRPGLPLFMVCVYGFDEYVEPTIGEQSRVFYAENFYRARPLEVAALYGNYNTMVLIWNATSLNHTASVRPEAWLEAAANNSKLDIWEFAANHMPVRSYETAVVLATHNSAHGSEMVTRLLDYPIDINEDLLVQVLPGCASFEILDMILARVSAGFTEAMLEAAVENPFINPELTEMILAKHQHLRVSSTCILSAVLKSESSPSSKAGVIKAVLNHSTRCEVSEEMICLLIRHYRSDDLEWLDLLLRHCSINRIPEDWLVAAAGSMRNGPGKLEFILNHTLDPPITQQVLQAALLNRWNAQNTFTTLISRPGCPSLVEESLYILIEEWSGEENQLRGVLEACTSMQITDAFLQTCAAQRSVGELKHVIWLPRAFPISKGAVCAAVSNWLNAKDMLELLLRIKSGFELEISEDILLQALSNQTQAIELAHILARQRKSLPVTEKSMMVAVSHDRDGSRTFEYLLQYCGSDEKMLTDAVLQAAIEADNIEFVEYFKQKKPTFEVKEEHLQAAAKNYYSTNNAILRILLSQETRCPISRPVLETAACMGNRSALELLLEHVAAIDVPPNLSDLTKQGPTGAEIDKTATCEEILLAASKEGEPDKYSDDLGTEKLELLLSKCRDPVLDSSRLIEVAAERRDGIFIVQYLLSRFPGTRVTRNALMMAASNEVAVSSLLDLLMKHSHVAIDLKILRLAAGNKYRGTQLVELLLTRYPSNAKIGREVIVAALKNHYCGKSLLKLFLARQPDLSITQDLVDAASVNEVLGKVLLQMLLKQALNLCATPSLDLILDKLRSITDGLRDSLFMAACYADEVILKFLVSHNVSLSSISGELGTALSVAIYAGNVDIVEILLVEGSDPECSSQLYGTPLQSACLQGNRKIVQILAKHGVEVDRPNPLGRTELHSALRRGDYDIVDTLISLGASTAKQDHQGMAAMHHACLGTNSADCVNLLIETGAPLDTEDSQQWTPLHWAAKSGAGDAVALLVEAGATKTKTDSSGKTPFEIAMLCKNYHLRPKLFIPDISDPETEHADEGHPEITCDFCDLVRVVFFSSSLSALVSFSGVQHI